jgi:2-dehydropantoate 2-reductase
LLAGYLARGGHEVDLVARGAHLDVIRKRGLTIVTETGLEILVDSITASDDARDFDVPDLVILAVKAHQIPDVAPVLPRLFGDETVVMTVQNGIPWWFFHRFGGAHEGRRIQAVDPNGAIERSVDPKRVLGCIAYPAAERPEPGTVRAVEGDQFPVGELDGSVSERANRIATALSDAGFRSRVLRDIRAHLWVKAWGNLAFNPISALTGGTLAEICRDPHTRRLASQMMSEAAVIAERLGIRTRVSIEQRIAGAELVGDHKTSMLQDVELGKELETDALIGAFVELGVLTGVATPSIDAVYACVKLRDALHSVR